MDLNELLVFARVAQAGSFTKAATQLGMPKSTVSRKVSELEKRLGSRLLHRTTRKLSLTDVGRTYYDYCARIMGEVEDAERAVSSLHDTPRGRLRVSAPSSASFLAPILSEYLKSYPEVQLEVSFTTRRVDLVEEGFDLAIRAGGLTDSTLIARSLGRTEWIVAAAPAYLKKRGRPRSPKDLKRHDYLHFGAGLGGAVIALQNGERSVRLSVTPRFSIDDHFALYAVTTAALGIAVLPAHWCTADLRANRLEHVLRGWTAPPTPIHVVYPSTRHVSSKQRSFIDLLEARMTRSPWGSPEPYVGVRSSRSAAAR
jgi:DNA-binding transcriptional LysR family regulator